MAIDPTTLKLTDRGEQVSSEISARVRATLPEIQQMAEMVGRGLMDRVDFFQQAYGMTEDEARGYRDRIDADAMARSFR